MGEMKIKIQVLIDSLKKKLIDLQEIEKLTKEQEQLLKADEFDFKAFNKIINDKQRFIDEVVQIDEGFKSLYEGVKGALKSNSELYRDEINQMKQLIREIGDLGINIQVLEERNKRAFETKTSSSKNKVQTFKKSKKAVTNYYSNMNKQKHSGNSFFFDSKK